MKKICKCEVKGKKNCHCNKCIIGIVALLIIVAIFFGFNKSSTKNADNKINSNKLLIKGNGNEPGWVVKVYGEDLAQKSFKADFILDYGDVAYSGVLAKTDGGSIDNNFQFRGDVNLITEDAMSITTKNVILYFEKAECVDDSGAVKNYKVELNLNSEREYQGCADLPTEVN